jgi:hypothetical protein
LSTSEGVSCTNLDLFRAMGQFGPVFEHLSSFCNFFYILASKSGLKQALIFTPPPPLVADPPPP